MFVMLLSVLVVLNLGRLLVPWSIVKVNGEDQTFLTLFEKLQAGCFTAVEVLDDLKAQYCRISLILNHKSTSVQDNLKRAVLLQTFVGAKMETLLVVSSG